MATDNSNALPNANPTGEWPLEYRINSAYFKLAYQCVLPAFEALDAGYANTAALLTVAFSPLVHAVLWCIAPAGIWSVLVLIRRLVCPPNSLTVTHFGDASDTRTFLRNRHYETRLALFDLRPGGGAEFREYPYVPLYDSQGRITTFYATALPLVVAVLQGWGTTLWVIHPEPTEQLPASTLQAQAQTQWRTLTQL